MTKQSQSPIDSMLNRIPRLKCCRLCSILIDVNYCVPLIIGIIRRRPVANANHTIFFYSVRNHLCLLSCGDDHANVRRARSELASSETR